MKCRLFRDVHGAALTPQGSVICIGAFDGLHRGHQALIGHTTARAAALGLPSVALSFEPLPREFFSQPAKPPRLSLPREKFEGLRALGVDVVGLLRFNHALSQSSAEAFIETVLVQRLRAKEVWVGPGFRFGRARRGDIAMLKQAGANLGFSADEIELVAHHGERVSSTRLREQLGNGDLAGATQVLGRRYAISGKVVHGQKLGRTLGFATANLRFAGTAPAISGVFAAWVHGLGDRPLASVVSVGTRPTVAGVEPLLEAHVFDFQGDLYGKRLRVEFVARIREEMKFDELSAMVQKMHVDARQAREILAADLIEHGVSG